MANRRIGSNETCVATYVTKSHFPACGHTSARTAAGIDNSRIPSLFAADCDHRIELPPAPSG
jgi:hypothetical protein